MEKFTTLEAVAAPLLRPNIDTDVIIPSREMKGVSKTGLAGGMFANWRYSDPARRLENPDFILNQPVYRQACILLAGENFGCGSSREHAVWALSEAGFRAVIAPSFGAIFYGNCIRNGVLPLQLAAADIAALAVLVEQDPEKNRIRIDLPAQTVGVAGHNPYAFAIPRADKESLVEGLDAVAVTLKRVEAIDGFEARDRAARPWVYLQS